MTQELSSKSKLSIPHGLQAGGESIALASENDNQEAYRRGWLAALSSAYGKRESVGEDRLRSNLLEIISEALKNGMTKVEIATHLENLGMKVEIKKEKTVPPKSKSVESSVPNINYREIADHLKVDDQKPRSSGEFIAPVVTNLFKDDDNPTLAGRAITSIYGQITERDNIPEFQSGEIDKLIEDSEGMITEFAKDADAINDKRVSLGLPPLNNSISRVSGTDGFHFNGEKRASREFLFYFSKSKANFKRNEDEIRAYISLSPKEKDTIHNHFTQLTMRLYDKGIDFTAKASSLFGVRKRADNMVFYISVSDQMQASEIIKEFLQEKKIGKGHVLAAIKSKQEGLSWAMEPNDIQSKVWQEITGSTAPTSFNAYVSARLIPDYFKRIAQSHKKKGNTSEADIFEKETERVESIIARLLP